ncbi:hypothetical protein TY90_18775 [Bacillus licheniformis]|nr:hypothetical protein TY90_18775 [Bacillus licheniformis]
MELSKSLLSLDLQHFAEETKDQAEPPAAEPKNTDTPEPPKDEVKTIPYDRFKQVNDDLKAFKSTFEELGIDGVDSLKHSSKTTMQRKLPKRNVSVAK